MSGNPSPSESPPRATARYPFAVPMVVELSNGILRRTDRVDALLVDLSQGGAAIVMQPDPRLRVKRRFRVSIDDHDGVIEVRNVNEVDDGRLRIGVAFRGLGLELQELVVDALENAQFDASRISAERDPFAVSVADATMEEIEAIGTPTADR